MTAGPTADAEPGLGVVYDIDAVMRIAPLRSQIGRLRALVTRGPRDRRSLLGMTRVLDMLAADGSDALVYYLSALPTVLAGPLLRALRHDQYPPGSAAAVLAAPRPPGRLRRHAPGHEQIPVRLRDRWLIGPAYRMVLDPDGRPWGARLRRIY